jgi:hypothetical protein
MRIEGRRLRGKTASQQARVSFIALAGDALANNCTSVQVYFRVFEANLKAGSKGSIQPVSKGLVSSAFKISARSERSRSN